MHRSRWVQHTYGYTDAGGWPGMEHEAAGTYTATIDLSSYNLTGAGIGPSN